MFDAATSAGTGLEVGGGAKSNVPTVICPLTDQDCEGRRRSSRHRPHRRARRRERALEQDGLIIFTACSSASEMERETSGNWPACAVSPTIDNLEEDLEGIDEVDEGWWSEAWAHGDSDLSEECAPSMQVWLAFSVPRTIMTRAIRNNAATRSSPIPSTPILCPPRLRLMLAAAAGSARRLKQIMVDKAVAVWAGRMRTPPTMHGVRAPWRTSTSPS